MALNLYIMRYDHRGEGRCDVYDSLLVAAASESDARQIHPVAEWSDCTKEDLRQWLPLPQMSQFITLGPLPMELSLGF